MKNFIIYTLLIFCLAVAIQFGVQQRKEKIRIKNNFDAEIQNNSDAQTATQKELTFLYDKVEDLTSKLKIKPKQIIQILETDYQVKDTANERVDGDTIIRIVRDSIYVTVDTIKFNIIRPCYQLSGYIADNRMNETINWRDTVSNVIYKYRPHKIWFIRYGNWRFTARTVSGCSDKVFILKENIKVVKEKS